MDHAPVSCIAWPIELYRRLVLGGGGGCALNLVGRTSNPRYVQAVIGNQHR